MNQYIITEEGVTDLDKYFMACKDDIIRIAWKNLKDKYIHPYQSERDKVLDEVLGLPKGREQPNGEMYIYVNKIEKLRQKEGQ